MHSCAGFEADTTRCRKTNGGNGSRGLECEGTGSEKRSIQQEAFSIHTQNKYDNKLGNWGKTNLSSSSRSVIMK